MGKLAEAAQGASADLKFPCAVTFLNGTTSTFDTAEAAEEAVSSCARLEYRRGGYFEAKPTAPPPAPAKADEPPRRRRRPRPPAEE